MPIILSRGLTASGGGGGGPVLQEQILVPAGGQASLDFQSISQTGRKILIEALIRNEAASTQLLRGRFNNDSGVNYTSERLSAAGGTITGNDDAGNTSGEFGSIPTSGASQPALVTIEIPFYAETTWRKWAMCRTAMHDGTGSVLKRNNVLWTSTAAINRVTLIIASGTDFGENSIARLYLES